MVDWTDYITQGAIKRGLDPKQALHVVDTEGGRSGVTGDSGTSFGPFQVHVGGTAPGTTAKGLGDEMLARGLDPKNPQQSIDYSLDYASAHGGFSPDIWHGLRGGAGGRGARPGEQVEGGTYVGLIGGRDEGGSGLSPTGSALLDSILKSRYGAAEEPTGNDLLDGLLKSSLFGTTQAAPQPAPTDDTAKQLRQFTPPPPPQTVPELSPGQPVPTPRIQPIQQPAMPTPPPIQPPAPVASTPMPGQPSVPSAPPVQPVGMPIPPSNTQGDFYQQNWKQVPPPVYQQETPGTAQAPGSADRNRFFNEQGVAPYRPPGVRDDREQEAAAPTGDNILDRILKQASPISTAQAAEREPPPQPQQQAPPAKTGNSLLDGLLDSVIRHTVGRDLSDFRSPLADLRKQGWAELAGQPIGDPADPKSLAAAAQNIEQGPAMAVAMSFAGGGEGGGPKLPARVPPRIEPPPLRETPQIGQSTELRPFAEGGGPPAIPPTGVARVPGAEPPPPGPGMVPHDQVRTTIDEPRPPKGDANESAVMKKLRLDAMDATQDLLWHNRAKQDSFINKMLRQIQDLPQLTGEQKLQMERYLEWQPGMPPVAIEAQVKKLADEFVKPMRELAAEDFIYLQKKGALENIQPEVLREMMEELTDGYMHRVRANRPGEQHPFSPFGAQRTMSRKTSAMKQRKFFVVQLENGSRHIYQGDAPKPNTPIYDAGGGQLTFKEGPNTRKIGEVRRATTEEIEQNSDVRYLHDPVFTQFLNFAQLRLARWNMDALEKQILPMLKDAGLSVTDAAAARRLGFESTIVPSLSGHWFTPRVAKAFNDAYKAPGAFHEATPGVEEISSVGKMFANLNSAAINLLFLDPLPHMRNVLMDYVVARGDLWWSPGGYVTGARAARQAFKDVMGRSQFYRDVMEKAGGALMGVSDENRVIMQAVWNRAEQDMTKLPWLDNVAKKTGVWQTGKDMAKGLWNKAQSIMWAFHDTLFIAHVRELMELKGVPLEEAVRQAERFMATYRVPASIGERTLRLSPTTARFLSRLMQDRDLTVFGRYHYNKLDALGNVLGDANRAMTKQGIPFKDRKEAIARLGTLLLWSTILQGGFNFLAQKVSGNPEARVPIPGAAGIPANLARVGYDLAWKHDLGQAAYDFWGGMASIISPLPAMTELIGQVMNRDWVTHRDIKGKELAPWKQGVQAGTHAAKTFLPPVDVLTDWRKALREFGGVSMPDPKAVAAARRPHPLVQRGEEKDFNRRFPWLRHYHPHMPKTFGIPSDALTGGAPYPVP